MKKLIALAGLVLLVGGCAALDALKFDAGLSLKDGPHILVGVDFRGDTNAPTE